ncbi:MAG: HAD-IA family hydrolase [Fimbriimonadaceae bacterium]
MKIRALTLDVGDTLLEDNWDPFGLWIECANDLGLTAGDAEKNLAFETVAGRQALRLLADKSGDEAAYMEFWLQTGEEWAKGCGWPGEKGRQVIADSAARVMDPTSGVLRQFEDVLPALEQFRSAGLKMGIVSNWDASLFPVLRAFGLDGWFESVAASGPVGAEKPDPAIFLAALGPMGVSPAEACHIGDDAIADLRGARGLNMRALLIDRKSPPSEVYVSSLDQVLERLV